MTVAGLLVLGAGLAGAKGVPRLPDALAALPFVLIGIGPGTVGHGMGELVTQRALARDPAADGGVDIEANDERNRPSRIRPRRGRSTAWCSCSVR